MVDKLTDDYYSDFENRFTLVPGKTAFIPLDLAYATACRTTGLGKILKAQGKEKLGQYRFDRIEQVVVPAVQKMLAYFRQHGLRIIYVTTGSMMADYSDILPHRRPFMMAQNNRVGEREHEVLDEIKPLPGEMVVNKTTTGAFNSSNLDTVLRTMGIEYCLFAGVSTHMCVECTARDAADRGYRCVLIEDALGASKPEFHNNALHVFQRGYGRVSYTDEIIRELDAAL